MPGPSDAELARAIAREPVRLRCQLSIDLELPSFELCRRRLQLASLHVRKQRLDGNYAASSSHSSLRISCSTDADGWNAKASLTYYNIRSLNSFLIRVRNIFDFYYCRPPSNKATRADPQPSKK